MQLFRIKRADDSFIEQIISVSYTETVNAGIDLRPGTVGGASIEVEAYGSISDAPAAGEQLTVYPYDSNDALAIVFAGIPEIRTANSYRFTAFDSVSKLDVDFSTWLQAHQADFPMTRAALVAAACSIAGVTNATPNWTGSTRTVQAFFAGGLTCRDILSYAAELSGCYVHCHGDGRLYFHWYSTVQNKRIYPSAGTDGDETRYAYKQNGLAYASYTVPAIDGVAVHPVGEEDVAYIYPATPAGDNLLHIRDNPLLTSATATVYNAAAQRIYTQMTAVGAYTPMTANLFPRENPYRAGDIAFCTDSQGQSFRSIVMTVNVTGTAATLESTGNETQDDSAQDTRKAIVQLASDIVQIDRLKVGYAEIAQAIIDVLIANDITAQNLTIVDEHGNVLATYDASGITLGQADEAHAFFDYNSMELLTKNGVVFFFVGDMRGADGFATLTELQYGALIAGQFTTGYIVKDVVRVTINGVATTNYTFNGYSNTIIINDSTADGDEIVATYKTNQLALHFDIGTRTSGAVTGAGSVAIGTSQTASGTYSTVGGGADNSATGYSCVVCGGYNNTAGSRFYATVCGGYDNTASGSYSFVGGGYDNTASANCSAVGGGSNNTASGQSAFVAGANNTASANFSTVFGQGNTATGQHQFVFGQYNSTDSAKVEIVGKGTARTPANARTLDWSGNEWLAGQINADTGNFRNGATSSGNIDITGGYLLRRLPAVPSAGTGYWVARVTESNGTTGRGGVQFYRSTTNGDGMRLSVGRTVNGSTVSNILSLYVDSNGNRTVTVSDKAAWQAGLGLVYVSGDSVTMGSYDRFAGDWRDTTNLWFQIPLTKPVASGVSASLSGSVIVISNGTRATVNLSNVTQTCRVTQNGIVVNLTWSSAPSYAVASGLANVQAYGATITFS